LSTEEVRIDLDASIFLLCASIWERPESFEERSGAALGVGATTVWYRLGAVTCLADSLSDRAWFRAFKCRVGDVTLDMGGVGVARNKPMTKHKDYQLKIHKMLQILHDF
jgi:hypothetical protein